VVYRNITRGSDNVRAAAAPRKETAFIHARVLMRQGLDVHRIEGPNGQVIGEEEIGRWVAANPH